jgi:hypothetical protein
MKDHKRDYLTDNYLRDNARPMLEEIISGIGDARDDLLDSLTQYAYWRIDAVSDKLGESERHKELTKRADSLESSLKSQICARQWEIAQEWDDTKHTLRNMHNEMLFLAGVREGIAFYRTFAEFK